MKPPALLVTLCIALACGDRADTPRTGAEGDARESERPRRVGTVAERSQARPPVYFIGLDGGDWQLLDRLMAEGRMPALAGLVREGHRGVLATEHPALSPLVWTTMMTGVGPIEHGVLDFVRFHPGTGDREPIGSEERKRPAIWNMATWAGKKVGLFGLWATYPAEPVDGVLVSDRLFGFLNLEDRPPEGAVYPPDRQGWATEALRRSSEAVDASELRRFLPWLTATDFASRGETERPYDDPVSALRRILIETRVYDQLFRSFVDDSRPDLAILYLQGTDSIGHLFAPYLAPKLPAVSAQDFARYQDVPALYFQWLDGLIAGYRKLAARDGAVLFLASDHGFRWQEGRPELSSFDVSTAAKWHRKEGMYLLWGVPTAAMGAAPEEKKDLHGGVRQVCATLLALAGLPPGSSVAGPPLPPIAAAPEKASAAATPDSGAIDYARIFEELRSRAQRGGTAAAPGAPSPGSADALAKLRALGYLDAAEQERAPAASIAAGSTRTAASYNNEALILQSEGHRDQARAAFEQALVVNPNLASALWNLSDLELASDNYDRADELLLAALANQLPEVKSYLIGRAIRYQRDGRLPRSMALLARAVEVEPGEDEYWLFLGRYRVEAGDCGGALQAFDRAAPLDPTNAAIPASAGVAHLCLGDRQQAAAAFRRSLELDPEQPKVRQFLRQPGAGSF